MWFSGGTQGEIFPYPHGVSGESCSLETLERVLGSVVYGTPVNTVRCRPQEKGTGNIRETTEQPSGWLYLRRLTVGAVAERSWSQFSAGGSPRGGMVLTIHTQNNFARQNFKVVASSSAEMRADAICFSDWRRSAFHKPCVHFPRF